MEKVQGYGHQENNLYDTQTQVKVSRAQVFAFLGFDDLTSFAHMDLLIDSWIGCDFPKVLVAAS